MKKRRLLVAGSVLFAFVANASTEAVWRGDVHDGGWTDPGCWADRLVPDANTPANLTASDGDYNIAVESTETLFATNVLVGNVGGLTVLNVNAPMHLFSYWRSEGGMASDVQFKQTRGAKTVVGRKGLLAFDGPDASYVTEGFVINESEFVVDGGKVDLNTCGPIALSGTDAFPAILTITNGGYFAWRSQANGSGRLTMPQNAKVRVHDGAFCLSQGRNEYWSALCNISGGEFEFSGTGVLSNGFSQIEGGWCTTPFVMRTGKMTFRDEARYWCGSWNDLVITPSDRGQVAQVDYLGSSRLESAPYTLTVGDSIAGGRAVLNLESSAEQRLGDLSTYVGFLAGQGELNISDGYVCAQGRGLYVGTVDSNFRDMGVGFTRPTDEALFAPTGIVRVSGGAIFTKSAYESSASDYRFSRLGGMLIGDASITPGLNGRPVSGTLEVLGGSVTNETRLVVGVGPAVGRVVQTGGTIWQGSTRYDPSWGNNEVCAIGLAGGDGAFVVSNGVTQLYTRMFVGGATTNDLQRPCLAQQTYSYPFDAHNAVGRLTVACFDKTRPCSFSIEYVHADERDDFQGIWVGRDGDGTLEMIGSGGSLTGYDIVLTNGYVNADGETLTHGQATVRCELDENGISPIVAMRNLKIAPNAKLVIDVEKYRGRAKKLKILDCANRIGSFSPENITVTGTSVSAVVLQDEKTAEGGTDPDIYIRCSKVGTCVIIR